MFWQFVVFGAQTLTLVKTPLKYLVFSSFVFRKSGPLSTTMGWTLCAVAAGFTVTVAEPDRVLSWTEVAVTVTGVMLESGGAVNRPEALMLPALADHVTAGLKGPVPDTVAEQVLVWPEATIEGAQVTLTEVMPEGFPPSPLSPPPQAAIRSALPMTKTDNPSLCMLSPRLADGAGVYALR
jgi:hypothetical protein